MTLILRDTRTLASSSGIEDINVISFTNPRDLPLLLGAIVLLGLLVLFMHKSLAPGGKLQRKLKERAWKIRHSCSKRVAAMLKDPALAHDLERRLEITLGDINLAKEEIRSLHQSTEEFLTQCNFQDDDGSSVGSTFAQMVSGVVLFSYMLFLLIIFICPLYISKLWPPLFMLFLISLVVADARYIIKKFGKGRTDICWNRSLRNESVDPELQERLLPMTTQNVSEIPRAISPFPNVASNAVR